MTSATPAPPLSVVIAAHNSCAAIGPCLDALEAQCKCSDIQVIVADSSTDGTDELTRSRYDWVELLHCADPLTVPELRGKAIARARGAVIAVLDPYSIANADWVRQVVTAHSRTSHPVIGGLVELHRPAERSWLEWALYFNEYGLFMPPGRRGSVRIVPGSNVSYKRSVLFDNGRPRYPVFWKTFVNWHAEAAGSDLWLEPAIQIALNKPIPFLHFLCTRYDHGRCFAGMRAADWPLRTRLLRAALAPLVPLVLMGRWSRGFWPKGRRRGTFLATLPLQLALFTVWALGEFVGCLRGTGRSCGRLYY